MRRAALGSNEDRLNHVSPDSFGRTVVSNVTVFEYSAFRKVVKAKFGQTRKRTKLDRTFIQRKRKRKDEEEWKYHSKRHHSLVIEDRPRRIQ